MSVRIALIPIKGKGEHAYLTYSRHQLPAAQKRLAGRYSLRPDVSLDDYITRAVIDWVTLRFTLLKPTQFQWVQGVVRTVVGRNLSVTPVAPLPGGVASVFDITFQEQMVGSIFAVHSALDRRFTLNHEPAVNGIEISVDFRPRSASATDRAKMYTVLTRHFFVDPKRVLNEMARPRFTWGRAPWKTRRNIAPAHDKLLGDELVLTTSEYDRAPYVDATYYVGSDRSSRRWRIMDKVIDQQDRIRRTVVDLSDEGKRVRVEVTLDRAESSKLGLNRLTDLSSFKFTRLQGEFFKFMLPTFPESQPLPHSRAKAMQSWQERQRESKFLTSGVIGLSLMDRALERRATEVRKNARSMLRKKNGRLKPWKHRSSGMHGTLIAYEELNKRVETALRALTTRMKGGAGRSGGR